MKRSFPFLVSMLCASAVLAEPPDPSSAQAGAAVSALVEKHLIAPLTKVRSKRKRFSRAAPVATQMRVRVLDEAPQTDARGKRFLRFAVDERLAWIEDTEWNEGTMRGCAYPEDKQVYVQRGEAYVSSRGALGEKDKPDPHACRAAPQPDTLASAPAPTRT